MVGGAAVAQQNQAPGGGAGQVPSETREQMPMQPGQMQQTQSGKTALSASEKQFLTKTASDATYEFISAQLAVQKAQNPQVQQYALRIMDDHATFNKALMQLGRQKGVTLPVDLNAEDRAKLARLMRLSGAAFDREYTQEVAKENAMSVSEMKRAASTAKDQDVQAFVTKFLPVDQEHLQIGNALKGSTTSSTGMTRMKAQ